MLHPPLEYDQNLLDVAHTRISASIYHEREVNEAVFQEFYDSLETPRAVGLGWSTTAKGSLTVLAICSHSTCILIQFANKSTRDDATLEARDRLQNRLLCNPEVTLYAFDMGRLALSLHHDRGLRIANAVHIQDACSGERVHNVVHAVTFAINGTDIKAFGKNIDTAFRDTTWDSQRPATMTAVVFRAWLAAYMPLVGDMEERFRTVKRVDTKSISDAQLRTLSQVDRGDQQLDGQRPDSVNNSLSLGMRVHPRNPHKARVTSNRFQSRLRARSDVCINIRDEHGHQYLIYGRTGDVSGQQAEVIARDTSFTFHGKAILDISTIGFSDPTQADLKRDAQILRLLQHQDKLTNNPFLQLIWPEETSPQWPPSFLSSTHVPPLRMDPHRPLNNSQQTAVLHMLKLHNDHRITLIQGPPGTGKTTVIATFVISAVSAGAKGIWLVAQSNVAVKNIAEKLESSGFPGWKLLVSKDFHQDWHEHLYQGISSKILRSDEFKINPEDLSGIKVILCTLSMLSHFKISAFTSRIPIQFLVVDEASQIKVSDYISPITANQSLRKICFIGDDKQLPPYGQEEIEEIESIFERPHIRTGALFLDIQYRMPPQIGDFISEEVYDGQLRSNPYHSEAKSPGSCFFVDVKGGNERTHGTSYTNYEESNTIISMAKVLQQENESFKIITPYDAQRSLIEETLKKNSLDAANKCFNVDSFQGNEEDIIILSLVRSDGLGFLSDLRRTNVMLTRCKKTLYICSSRAFVLDGPGKDSLVGRMAAKFGEDVWIDLEDVTAGNF